METSLAPHAEPSGFLTIIFNQHISELLHEALTVGIVEIFKIIVLAVTLLLLHEVTHRWRLRHRDHSNQVSISINYLERQNEAIAMSLRPLNKETSVDELFHNIILRRAFIKAAAATTVDSPIMMFPLHLEAAIMNTLQTFITDDFTEGFIRKAIGLPVVSRYFVFMAVNEKHEDISVRKIRIVVTEMILLENIPDRRRIIFEKEHQIKRVATMDHIAARYRNLPDARQKRFRAEICLSCEVGATEPQTVLAN